MGISKINGSVDGIADRVFFSEQREAFVADDMLDTARFVLGGVFFDARAHEDCFEVAVLCIDALCFRYAFFGEADEIVVVHRDELLVAKNVHRAADAGLAEIHLLRQLKGADRALKLPLQQKDGFEIVLS